ncbi:MAG: hypothetical protein DRI94_05205 [Bacteroidetes bacterium]|nr:MAG: hypothetical protein DRI94_05205 [Bacteroidota bacterium]
MIKLIDHDPEIQNELSLPKNEDINLDFFNLEGNELDDTDDDFDDDDFDDFDDDDDDFFDPPF